MRFGSGIGCFLSTDVAVDALVVCVFGIGGVLRALLSSVRDEVFVILFSRSKDISISLAVCSVLLFGSSAIAMPLNYGASSGTRDLALFDFALSFSEFEIKAAELSFGAGILTIGAQCSDAADLCFGIFWTDNPCLELQCCSCPVGIGRSGMNWCPCD
jgi:hypothetical protein